MDTDLFKENFKLIYGIKVWEDFLNYHKKRNSFVTIAEIKEQLKNYKKRFKKRECDSNKFIGNEGVKNFYKGHPQFTRFVLITLERYYGHKTESFEKKVEVNANIWETEHIISQKNFNRYINDSTLKHWIGNLTLISRSLNNREAYKKMDTPIRKRILMSEKSDGKNNKYSEWDFYLNKIFRDIHEGEVDITNWEETIIKRGDELQKDFESIFSENNLENYFEKILKNNL